jgi:hypothetical protein
VNRACQSRRGGAVGEGTGASVDRVEPRHRPLPGMAGSARGRGMLGVSPGRWQRARPRTRAGGPSCNSVYQGRRWPTSGNGAKSRVSVFYAWFDDRQTIATAAPGRALASEPAFRNFLSGKRKDAERSDHPRGAVGRSMPDAALIPRGR